jgi:hypothetical protein
VYLNGEATTVYGQAYQVACRNIAKALRSLPPHVSGKGEWRWQPVSELPVTADPPAGTTFPSGDEYLLWSPNFGRRTASVLNWRGHLHGSVTNLHGCAFKDWGATMFCALPTAPDTGNAGGGK